VIIITVNSEYALAIESKEISNNHESKIDELQMDWKIENIRYIFS
jgi:hypothetical protein